MNLLFQLKNDINTMINLQRRYAELNTSIIYHANMNDKTNYNPELVNKMNVKQREISEQLTELKNKWGL